MTATIDDLRTTSTRLRFFPRQLITADDLNQEQRYHREKLREHNRFLHGWGVVCGCDVQLAGGAAATTSSVVICPGYVLTPQGDAVWIRAQATFDVATCWVTSGDPCALARPCPPLTMRSIENNTLYLAVRYAECTTQPVRVGPQGCSCDDAECEYSRIVDAYEFCCLSALPDTHKTARPACSELFRSDRITACPDCSDDPWVVLATLTLAASRPVAVATVDTVADRRALFDVRRLQEIERCLAHGITAPWHAEEGQVYHDNLFCSVGRAETTPFEPGTGNSPYCTECDELGRRWPATG